jgi:hypothetical protein
MCSLESNSRRGPRVGDCASQYAAPFGRLAENARDDNREDTERAGEEDGGIAGDRPDDEFTDVCVGENMARDRRSDRHDDRAGNDEAGGEEGNQGDG